MGWDSEAQKLVFELFNQGQPEASIVKQVIGRHPCNGKTVRRCIAGLRLAQLQPEGHQPGHLARERFENLGGTDHYASELLRAYQAHQRDLSTDDTRGGPSSGAYWPPGLEDHRPTLLAPLLELKGVQSLGMHDYDLAIWHGRPKVSCWPLAKGQVCRSPSGTLEVSLDIESRLEYRYLRQHLPHDQIWSALESFKRAMAVDIEARLVLLHQITTLVERREAEGGTGLSVVPDLDFGAEKEAVSAYYVFTIHDQVLSRCLGLNHAAKERREFSRQAPNLTRLGSYTVISGPDEKRHEELVELLLKAQKEWTGLPEAGAAAEAYRRAEEAAAEVRQQVDRLRLAVGFPPGSRCDGCDPLPTSPGRGNP